MIKTILEWLGDSTPWLKVVIAVVALAIAAGLGYTYASNEYRAEISAMVADYEQRKAETEKEFRTREKEFAEKLLKEVERITKIPVEQQYLSIEEFENWGKNGEYL